MLDLEWRAVGCESYTYSWLTLTCLGNKAHFHLLFYDTTVVKGIRLSKFNPGSLIMWDKFIHNWDRVRTGVLPHPSPQQWMLDWVYCPTHLPRDGHMATGMNAGLSVLPHPAALGWTHGHHDECLISMWSLQGTVCQTVGYQRLASWQPLDFFVTSAYVDSKPILFWVHIQSNKVKIHSITFANGVA